MRKYIASVVLITILLLFVVFSNTIFQEGNPIPVAVAITQITVTGKSFTQLDEHRFIVKSSDKDIQKLKDYLLSKGMKYTDQMGSGIFFVGEKGEKYTAMSRMYTTHFQVWEFNNPLPNNK